MVGMQGLGVFGTMESGGALYQSKLMRSALPPAKPEFQLLPQPRGAISDLKPVPLPSVPLKQGEIKAHPAFFPCI